jgi:hypothetical protein
MRARSRLAWSTALLVVLILGAAHTQPTWLARHGLDWWNLAGVQQQLQDEQKRSATLSGILEVSIRRSATKAMVIRELIAGQVSVLEAAAWFRELNQAARDSYTEFDEFTAPTDAENLYREILRWTEVELGDWPPSQAKPIWQRLQEEFEELQNREGCIRFPS